MVFELRFIRDSVKMLLTEKWLVKNTQKTQP